MEFRKKKINDPITVKRLSEECKISYLLADLLVSRGIEKFSDAQKYLYGTANDFNSPYLFPDLTEIIARIKKAFENDEKIIVYGDYDCDGVGATAILTLACKEHGITLNHYIPTRAKEGYGLNRDAIRFISEKFSPDLMITVDCGIKSVEEVALAKEIGMDIIVTDHHQPGEILPDCPIMNPFLAAGSSPLCGAGVVFTLVSALFGIKTAMHYVDICAVSTLADIVPLTGDNRLIVRYGMEAIRKGRCRPGIKELLFSAKADLRTITTGDIGFKVAPRINAAGRLKSAEVSLRLLTDDDPTSLHMIADQLTLLNAERQDMNAKIFDEAMEMLKNYDFSRYKIIMLKGDWLEGVVGIVCAKLTEYFNLPTIMVCRQEGKTALKGSARSIAGINLFELFDKNNSKLVSYGGHAMAAGISIEEKDFDAVLNQFNDYILSNTDKSVFEKVSYYDEQLNISDLSEKLIKEIELMEPFGHKNPSPIFFDVSSEAKFRQIGRTQHIKAKFRAGELVAFDKFQFAELADRNNFSFTYTVEKNYFNGKVTTQFMLKDLTFTTNDYRDEDLAENFCKTFLPRKTNGVKADKKSGKSPTLFVAYGKNSAEKILREHPGINVAIFRQTKCELKDTLAVAPSDDFPFAYYSEIVFADRIGDNFRAAMESSGSNCVFGTDKAFSVPIGIDELRGLFSALKKNLFTPKKLLSINALFSEVYPTEINDDKKRVKFIVGCYIFLELGLLKLSDDGIIYVENKKVELTKSTLYNYVNG